MAVLITNPHCGVKLSDCTRIYMNTAVDGIPIDDLIIDQSDLGARQIYGVPEANDLGARALEGDYTRLMVDLNRPWQWAYVEGYGSFLPEAVPLKDFEGRSLYAEGFNMRQSDINTRALVWDRYHAEIKYLIGSGNYRLLIDSHTMKDKAGHPDICIGTRYGKACDERLGVHAFENVNELFRGIIPRRDLVVSCEKPYPGRFILEDNCERERAEGKIPGFSVEINRSLFADGNGKVNGEIAEDMNYRFQRFLERMANY